MFIYNISYIIQYLFNKSHDLFIVALEGFELDLFI